MEEILHIAAISRSRETQVTTMRRIGARSIFSVFYNENWLKVQFYPCSKHDIEMPLSNLHVSSNSLFIENGSKYPNAPPIPKVFACLILL